MSILCILDFYCKYHSLCKTNKVPHSLFLTKDESAQTLHHSQNVLCCVLKKAFMYFISICKSVNYKRRLRFWLRVRYISWTFDHKELLTSPNWLFYYIIFNIDTQEIEQGQACSPWVCTIFFSKTIFLCRNKMIFCKVSYFHPNLIFVLLSCWALLCCLSSSWLSWSQGTFF